MKTENTLKLITGSDETEAPKPVEEEVIPVERLADSSSLVKIIEMLEPIQFAGIRKQSVYHRFLKLWESHVHMKLNGTTKPFDFRQLATVSAQDFANQTIPKTVKVADFKVIGSDVIIMTARVIGHPIMFQMGKFFVFDGMRWVPIEEGEFNAFIKFASIRMQVDRMLAPDAAFLELMNKQLASMVIAKPKGMLRNILNFRNGTLEIESSGNATLREHRADDLLHYVLPYDYDPEATCPRWQSFLDEVIPEPGKQDALAEFLGSCFSDVKHEKILFLYGTGANGKSVVMEVVIGLFGSTNIVHNTLEEISDEKGYNRGNLMTALLNYSGEISDKVSPDVLKRLASREPMTGRYVRGKPFEVKDYCRSAFNGNVLPRVKEVSDGFFRRFLIVPFEVTIPMERRDPDLPAKIMTGDLPGIMNWVVSGLQRLLAAKGRFSTSEASERILAHYMEAVSHVAIFVEEFGSTHHGEINSTVLYDAYKAYCETNEFVAVNTKDFSIQLQAAKCRRIKRRSGIHYRLPDVQGAVQAPVAKTEGETAL